VTFPPRSFAAKLLLSDLLGRSKKRKRINILAGATANEATGRLRPLQGSNGGRGETRGRGALPNIEATRLHFGGSGIHPFCRRFLCREASRSAGRGSDIGAIDSKAALGKRLIAIAKERP
jgi:hypothetical protein